jgi:hypothetical protein
MAILFSGEFSQLTFRFQMAQERINPNFNWQPGLGLFNGVVSTVNECVRKSNEAAQTIPKIVSVTSESNGKCLNLAHEKLLAAWELLLEANEILESVDLKQNR